MALSYRYMVQNLYEAALRKAEGLSAELGIDIHIPMPAYVESRRRNYEAYGRKIENIFSKALSPFDEHNKSTRGGKKRVPDTPEEQVFARFEETLFNNYMTRLNYYQHVPSVKAIINTIESDDRLKSRILKELTGHGSGLPLPELKQVGYYEAGMELASQVQDFLNSTTGEQILDEGYQPDV